MHAKGVKELVKVEPWRAGQGRSRTNLVKCHGKIEWEKTDRNWWWCRTCGYCGYGSYITHYAPNSPEELYKERIAAFYFQKQWQGLTATQAKEQACHLFAAVIKKATFLEPDELGAFIDRIMKD